MANSGPGIKIIIRRISISLFVSYALVPLRCLSIVAYCCWCHLPTIWHVKLFKLWSMSMVDKLFCLVLSAEWKQLSEHLDEATKGRIVAQNEAGEAKSELAIIQVRCTFWLICWLIFKVKCILAVWVNKTAFYNLTNRERMIRALTDTIWYEYSSVHNGRYRYRYEYSLCHGVPATYIIRTGRSLRERSLYTMGGTLHPRLNNADH